MNILIAGATGFIGRHLVNHWTGQHNLIAVGRNKEKLKKCFSNQVSCIEWNELPKINANELDVVINLSGYNISQKRWTSKVKQEIIDSRVKTTESLINWLSKNQAKPHFYCANAIGIYGLQQSTDTCKTEDSVIEIDNPPDFLTQVGVLWKQAAEKANDHDIPLTITCFGVVLSKGEGMLKKLAPAYNFCMGSIIGSGEQIISWIHIDDIVKGYDFLIEHPEITGLVNLCSPNPVSQKSFAQQLAHSMNRPLLLRTPAFVIRTLFGEMGECLIIEGQGVIPKRLQELGFEFNYPAIDEALQTEYGKL